MAILVVWEQVYEKHRRAVLTSSMLGVVGRIQREGEVVHIIAYRLIGLSAELSSLGGRDGAFPLPHGRGRKVITVRTDEIPAGPRVDRTEGLLGQKSRNFH